jgi:hypothetical protein
MKDGLGRNGNNTNLRLRLWRSKELVFRKGCAPLFAHQAA